MKSLHIQRLTRSACLAGLGLAMTAPIGARMRTAEPIQAGQIEERSITARGGLDPFDARDEQELMEIFDDAESLFASAQQADSIEVFGGLIARLDSDRRSGVLSDELRSVLISSLARRAEARFNLAEGTQAEQDLTALLAIEPGWTMNSDMVSPKLVDLFSRLRRQTIGELLLQLKPPDATVFIGDRRLDNDHGPEPLPAGEHVLRVSRAGFATLELPVEVTAGTTEEVTQELERVSAVIRLRTSPPGAQLLVDELPAQVAHRARAEASKSQATPTSETLEIEGLQPGRHDLRFQLQGFRERRLQIDIDSLADYEVAAVMLEPSRGELLLSEVPVGATVTLDGQPADTVIDGSATAKLVLPPAEYKVSVALPGVGVFSSSAVVEDRRATGLTVELQPTIAFLGILGNDRLAAGSLTRRLAGSFPASKSWIWSDRALEVQQLTSRLKLDATALRRLSNDIADPSEDLEELRSRVTEGHDESIFLVAVLGDDLFATTADLWLWSPSPWPARPRVLSVSLADDDPGLSDFIAALDQPVVARRARLGMLTVDSAAADGPIVSSTVTEGPAESAGIEEGDEILSIANQKVDSSAKLLALASSLAPGTSVNVQLVGPNGQRDTALELDQSFALTSLTDADVVGPVLAAKLAIELRRRVPALPLWVLQLQQAAVYLRASAFEEAVPLLRTIEAPNRSGLGRATADYWLGSTLLSIDGRTYAEAARTAFERVLASPGARLGHDDGPLLAPRARAKLAELARLVE